MQEFIRIEKFVPWPARWWNGKQFEYQWPLARRVRSLARSLQDSEGEPETRDWISESYHYKIEKRPAKILAKSGKVGLRFAEFAHLVYLWYTKNSIDTQRTALIHKEQHWYTKSSIDTQRTASDSFIWRLTCRHHIKGHKSQLALGSIYCTFIMIWLVQFDCSALSKATNLKEWPIDFKDIYIEWLVLVESKLSPLALE